MTVTRVLFDSSAKPVATGVEYTSAAGAEKKTVKVKKEVILTAGVIGSPQVGICDSSESLSRPHRYLQILMVSGVGPKDIVEGAGVSSVADLAGIGHHLQDHIKAGVVFKANGETAGDVHAAGGDESVRFKYYCSPTFTHRDITENHRVQELRQLCYWLCQCHHTLWL